MEYLLVIVKGKNVDCCPSLAETEFAHLVTAYLQKFCGGQCLVTRYERNNHSRR